ncbi:MAG: amino acid ABC transporter ATP-binding protein [Clostridiaceae bacterium]|nr:amino acid ABC transporter ATP-binding protein [Clostridiaceae bacterium]
MAILEITDLAKSFGNTEVLKDINFSIEAGESLAIIGSSGSGKTTLLRCLNFLEKPDSGRIKVRDEVLFDGADQNSLSEHDIRMRRLHFGLVFQSFNLFPQYTALENVILAKQLLSKESNAYKKNKKALNDQIIQEGKDWLAQVGLETKQDLYPHQLSGGQQQRVAIARALALKPDILCFDEPTSALDPELTGEVLKVIRSLSEKNETLVIVTHEMQFAYDVADKILFMDEGFVVEYGTPSDVFDNPTNERTKRFLERYKNSD